MCTGYMHIHTTAFYVRNLSICRFWYPQEISEPILHGHQGTIVLLEMCAQIKWKVMVITNFNQAVHHVITYYSECPFI